MQRPEIKERVQFFSFLLNVHKKKYMAGPNSHLEPLPANNYTFFPSLGQCHFRRQETDSNSQHQTFGEDQRQQDQHKDQSLQGVTEQELCQCTLLSIVLCSLKSARKMHLRGDKTHTGHTKTFQMSPPSPPAMVKFFRTGLSFCSDHAAFCHKLLSPHFCLHLV